jgi:CRP/FNR family transcriptional regulator, anaerobic regulatory protein
MNALEQHIQASFGVTEEERGRIGSYFEPLELKKGDFFLRAGTYSDRMGFVQDGLLREFLVIEEKEVTKWIVTPGQFAMDLGSFLFGHPARVNLQALSDCTLQVLPQASYRRIAEDVPRWMELEKRFIAKCFGVLEDRIISHLVLSAEQRYRQLYQFNRALFQQVPQHYLASMLGMTPETMSRLRRQVGA